MDEELKTLVNMKYKIPNDFSEYINIATLYPASVVASVSAKWLTFYISDECELTSYEDRCNVWRNLLIESLCEYESKSHE